MQCESVRPLLKWAGGKRQLLPELRRFYPRSFNQYWEPFFGSGAAFFDLSASGRLAGHAATLLDNNPDLVACYKMVRDAPDAVVAELEHLEAERQTVGSRHYYDVRDGRFNPLREALRTELEYTPELAAMLIYLNRTGFNGLFRLNAAGGFNVPAGRYERPRICNPENIHRVANALSQPGVSIACLSFDRVLEEAKAGDFLYFDPPYAPLSRTARFTSYTAGGFGMPEQRRLQKVIIELAGRGCLVLLSNSTAREISALYERNIPARKAGLRCHRVRARRAINSNGARRGAVTEFLITNIPAA